jgi:hypothetical protein
MLFFHNYYQRVSPHTGASGAARRTLITERCSREFWKKMGIYTGF